MSTTKPFVIDKWLVYEALKAVKANAGSAGVDRQSLVDFEADLKGNLYKVWDRMSSGSYFPDPVKAVAIPKKNGGERLLGLPTVSDCAARMVVKRVIEPETESIFLPDSYGYRPGKSALDAVGITRKRCWKYDWVLEFDIKGLFDNIDHDLLQRALRKHVKSDWAMLYIDRWLKAPVATGGRNPGGTNQGDSAGRCHYPMDAKDNFGRRDGFARIRGAGDGPPLPPADRAAVGIEWRMVMLSSATTTSLTSSLVMR